MCSGWARGAGGRDRARLVSVGPDGRVIWPFDISSRTDTVSDEMPAATTQLMMLPSPRLDLVAPDVTGPATLAALLSDQTRAGILALLRGGAHCVCEMAAALGERQNNVSNHLARLRDAGLVRASRHGADARWVYYERYEAACERAAAVLTDLLR